MDFLLRAHRHEGAARGFLERAIDLHGVPEKITIEKSGANTAAIASNQADSGVTLELRQPSTSTTSSIGTIGHRARRAADGGVQVDAQGAHPDRRYRDDAHDS